MPLPTAYGTIPLGGALPEAYIPVDSVPLLGGALESGYGEVSYAVNMTAAASGSNGITVADDDDIDFGTGDFFLHWEGSLDVAPPASIDWICIKYQNGSNYWGLRRNTNGTLTFIAVVAGTTIISCTSSASSIVSGKICKITVSGTRESASANGSASFYYGGTLFSTAVITAIAVRTISNSGALYISGDDARRIASNTITCVVGNFAPTAAEVLDLCTNGIPESWKWGSQTQLVTDGSFSGGPSGWTVDTGVAIVDQGGGDYEAVFTASGTNTEFWRAPVVNISTGRYLVTYTITSYTGGTFRPNVAGIVGTARSSAGTFSEIVTITSAGAQRVGIRGTSASNTARVDDFSVIRVGATMALLPNTIPTSASGQWDDSSGNTGGGTLPAAGATKVTIRK